VVDEVPQRHRLLPRCQNGRYPDGCTYLVCRRATGRAPLRWAAEGSGPNAVEKDYTEDKLAGVLFLQEILLPAGALNWHSDLPRFARLLDQGYIQDWSVCDWFCVKVLGPLVEQQGERCARAISKWREADGVWQRRASVVAFANLASRGDQNFPGFTEMVLDSCTHLLGSQERFAQTGVGWILRELSRSERGRVVGFVEANLNRLSREALKNATKYLPAEVAERLRQAHLLGTARGRRRE
jgi:3-methyladenine DNA glycosylase AlkD